MTTKKNQFTGFKKLLLMLPLLLFTFCDSQEDIVILNSTENLMTKDSRIAELFIKVATSNMSSQKQKNSEDTLPVCTGFQFPLTFEAYHEDKNKSEKITVENDEELLKFFSTTLTAENPYYAIFPVTLLDAEGEETEINGLEVLENTLHMSVNICDELDDKDSDDSEYETCGNKNKKITLCHKGKTLCVSVNAMWGHKNNHREDYLGKCN